MLVVVDDVAEVVAAAVVGFADAHGVVGEVDLAVVAEEFRHRGSRVSDWKVVRREECRRERIMVWVG